MAPLLSQYWGGTKHFFLLILYNFRNIGGHVPPCPPPPYSAVPVFDAVKPSLKQLTIASWLRSRINPFSAGEYGGKMGITVSICNIYIKQVTQPWETMSFIRLSCYFCWTEWCLLPLLASCTHKDAWARNTQFKLHAPTHNEFSGSLSQTQAHAPVPAKSKMAAEQTNWRTLLTSKHAVSRALCSMQKSCIYGVSESPHKAL